MPLKITTKKSYPFSSYEITEKELSETEKKLFDDLVSVVNGTSVPYGMEELNEKVNRVVDKSKIGKIPEDRDITQLADILSEFLKEKVENPEDFVAFVLKKVFGGDLLLFLTDPELEEIMITGGKPVFVYHRKHGPCKTNITFTEKEIYTLLYSLDVDTRKPISTSKTLYGSRVTVTLPPLSQPTINIRKFRVKPYSITELIANGTLSSELAAFLWLCVDGLLRYPMNMMVVGGSAGGKTTLLNALSVFIPPNERILTIEDVLELNLGSREYWIQLSPKDTEIPEVIKTAVRMRPERVIIGEIRGREAQELFSAMNVGARGILTTMHSDTAREAVLRLQNRPMSVPKELIPCLDIILAVNYTFDRRKGAVRRISEVCEVSRMQEETVGLNQLFTWNQAEDTLSRTDVPSAILEIISKATNHSISELRTIMKEREEILEHLIKKKVFDFSELVGAIDSYYAEFSKNQT